MQKDAHKIFEMPFSLYSTFVIEARHSSHEQQQTVGQFVTNWFVGLCVCGLFGAPVVAAAILIVQRGGSCLVMYLWLFSLIVSVSLTTVYPHIIAPLFNNHTPLPRGGLRKKIKNLASCLDFPLDEIFVEAGSGTSTHSNAYMYGVLKKSIVLDSTLIQQGTDEVVAIIAHEIGHWRLNHTSLAFVALQVFSLFQFGVFDHVRQSRDLFQHFGFDTQPIVIGFYIFQHVVMPVQRLLSFGMNLLSRSSEFEADAFAKSLGYGTALRAGLMKLQEQNLSALNTDPWYSAYHFSHPPLAERLDALDSDKKSE